ncbi:MAG: hypothetical protein WDN24_15755 [Sphingomonas sp.]
MPEVIGTTSAVAEEVLEPLRRLEKRQLQVAARAQAAGEERYRATADQLPPPRSGSGTLYDDRRRRHGRPL